MALAASEDSGLLLSLNMVAGLLRVRGGALYRKWEGQMTAQQAHVNKSERDARMGIIDSRAQALAGLGWTFMG